MNVAIIGAGNVGGTLGVRWAQKGHFVKFGVRDSRASKVRDLLAKAGSNATACNVAEATAASDCVVLTVPWEAAEDALKSAGNLNGKILIDATNPLEMGMDGLKKGLLLGHTTSAGEQVATWAVGARVVKAFNSTGYPNMAEPDYGGAAATMFLCGDDEAAKSVVTSLGQDLGFTMIDAGPLSNARLLEPLAMLWIDLALFRGLGTSFALNVVKRAP